MGFFSAIKKIFGKDAAEQKPSSGEKDLSSKPKQEQTLQVSELAVPQTDQSGDFLSRQQRNKLSTETISENPTKVETDAEASPDAGRHKAGEFSSVGKAETVWSSAQACAECEKDKKNKADTGTGNGAFGKDELCQPLQENREKEKTEYSECIASHFHVKKSEETNAVATGAGSNGGKSPFRAEEDMTLRLREAEPKLSSWLDVVLQDVTEAGSLLNERILFLLHALQAPESEAEAFVGDFSGWLKRMDYHALDEFRSELQYRLALALDLEDEEDERSRLFIKLSEGLARTRQQFSRRLDSLFASHGELNESFWSEMEELFIMADLGYEAALELTNRLKERARKEKVTTGEGARELLRREIKDIFARPRRIVSVNPPEVVLMIGVNGAGKTTTIAKLAYRDRMQGKKVMIAAADTFRAAAIDQLRVWAERVGTLFHAKTPGADPASVAYEAMGRALEEKVDVLYVDTAGRLQTKVNLMDELSKIRQVLSRRHPGAPHRTILVLDATTGQNALSQAKLFKESAGVDELILTKLDGTAKGGVAIAVAMQYNLAISYVGLGEKVEDLRPFNGDDYADALLASV